jgi:hypothetical protein
MSYLSEKETEVLLPRGGSWAGRQKTYHIKFCDTRELRAIQLWLLVDTRGTMDSSPQTSVH